jgi:hypothetical protein
MRNDLNQSSIGIRQFKLTSQMNVRNQRKYLVCISPPCPSADSTDKSKTVAKPLPKGIYAFFSHPIAVNLPRRKKKKNPLLRAGLKLLGKSRGSGCNNLLLLPSALFVAISFQTLATFVLRHLQTTFLFEVAHGG